MNLVFAGTPEFSVPSLKALIDAGHRIVAVYTQPDRPAGRGRKLAASAVKEFAVTQGIEVRQPTTLKHPDEAPRLAALAPDAMIVIAYGLLLPKAILDTPRFGCINVHASLLPRWRGAAPIQRALEAGDRETGVTIMQMEEGLDTGPMLAIESTPIHDEDTGQSLHDRLSQMGATLLTDTLTRLERGDVVPEIQDNGRATYASKLKKEESRIDWTLDVETIARRVRAFNPWPVTQTILDGKPLRIWMAQAEPGAARVAAGTIVSADTNGICVAGGNGVVRVTRLQAEGGKPLSAREFLNGHAMAAGTILGR